MLPGSGATDSDPTLSTSSQEAEAQDLQWRLTLVCARYTQEVLLLMRDTFAAWQPDHVGTRRLVRGP